MKKKLAIVLISVEDFTDGRKSAENILDGTFRNADEVRKQVREEQKEEGGDIYVLPLNNFVDACNDQHIVSMEEYWISYVYITDKYF